MSYEDAINPHMTVRRAQAAREIAKHGASWTDFVRECGDLAEYRSIDVLVWLGY